MVVSPNLDSRIVNILTPPAYEMKVIKASLYAQIYEKKRNNVKKKKQKCFILI